jgi:hypothetical protein
MHAVQMATAAQLIRVRVRRIAYLNGTVETDGLNLSCKYSYTA